MAIWEVSLIFSAGLLEFVRIAGNRVEKVEMVSVAAASAKTTE
jgi:hypothetical protein